MFSISPSLSKAYDEQYSSELTEWRETGGKAKADNILALCRNLKISTALECGAGEGSILKWLDSAATFEHLYAIEISDSGINRINERALRSLVEVRKFAGYSIPYPDRKFDLAICSHVIEHVEHPRLLLRELARVSRFQVVEVPLDYSPGIDRRAQHMMSYGHINAFTPSLFRFLLLSEGFSILDQRLTHLSMEVRRFMETRGSKSKIGLWREMRLRASPVKKLLKRLLLGSRRFDEFGYAAYTCLTRFDGPPSILGGSSAHQDSA